MSWAGWGSGLLSGASDALAKAKEATTAVAAQVTSKAVATHEEFLAEKSKYSGPDEVIPQEQMLPWEFDDPRLHRFAEECKERVLKLSQDDRTFTTPVPDGVAFEFDFDTRVDVATKLLELDAALSKARFKLVPKKVSEPDLWKNYFYRALLIRESYTMRAGEEGDLDDAVGAGAGDSAGSGDGSGSGGGGGDVVSAAAEAAGSAAGGTDGGAGATAASSSAAGSAGESGTESGGGAAGAGRGPQTTAARASDNAVAAGGETVGAEVDATDVALEDPEALAILDSAVAGVDADDGDGLDIGDNGDFEAALEEALRLDDADAAGDAGDGEEDELEERIRRELGLGDELDGDGEDAVAASPGP